MNREKHKCPVCEKKEYIRIPREYDGYTAVAPAEGFCEWCGFAYMEDGLHSEQQQAEAWVKYE